MMKYTTYFYLYEQELPCVSVDSVFRPFYLEGQEIYLQIALDAGPALQCAFEGTLVVRSITYTVHEHWLAIHVRVKRP